jgi:hypothetical protein
MVQPGDVPNPAEAVCRVCHAPHDRSHASQRYLNGLWWNQAVSPATCTMYDSGGSSTLDGARSAGPDALARLSLACPVKRRDVKDSWQDSKGTRHYSSGELLPFFCGDDILMFSFVVTIL